MNHFAYRDGALCAEDVALGDIATAVGTPFYCYSDATLSRHYRVFVEAFAGHDVLVAYSLKANSNQAVIATLARLGAGADVVSEGELRRAMAAGIAPARMVFSGVGKTAQEMALALDVGVLQFNVESEPELALLSSLAAARGKRAPVALRINPDVHAGSHDKISTGRKQDKFGVALDKARALYARAAQLAAIEVVGIDVHIGSQLTALNPFRDAFARVAALIPVLRADGHDIRHIDLGGGLGISYGDETPPHPEDYARLVGELTRGLGCRLILEPGRMLVGNAGVLVARVIYVKETDNRRFVIVDAAMNDLMRPALYGAWHAVEPVVEAAANAPLAPVDIVGPVCESADIFAAQRPMPPLGAGDLIAFRTAGAYGAVMASNYNSRLLVPEVMVKGGRFAVVRPRADYAELIGRDRLPEWLDDQWLDEPAAGVRRAAARGLA